jgi:hypothetical protein
VVDGFSQVGSPGATSGRALGGSPFDPPPSGDDWPARLTDTIVGYIQKVRAATTGRALVASRAVVYFLAAGLIGGIALVLAIVLLFRLLSEIAQGHTWIVYLCFGVVFTAVGLFAWSKKERPATGTR